MSNDGQKISSLRDLPRDIAPPRDLWQGIEARLAAEGARGVLTNDRSSVAKAGEESRRARRVVRMRVLAAAAMVATLAVGIWIGRAVSPVTGGAQPVGGVVAGNGAGPRGTGQGGVGDPGGANGQAGAPADGLVGGAQGEAIPASLVMDPKYMRQRTQLLQSLQAQIAALPPDTRAKVMASLQTIHDSMRDLEAALGKDPSNALLQELLVNTYQDEMRVLTAVHEAGPAGEGI
jgi:hypothetical protein